LDLRTVRLPSDRKPGSAIVRGKVMAQRIIASVLIVAMMFGTACTCLLTVSSVDRSAITSDGSGGAMVIYEIYKSQDERDFFIQRVGPDGDFLWGDKGKLIDSGYKNGSSLFELFAVSDGSGGAVVIWSAYSSRPDWKLAPGQRETPRVTHIAKIDSEGDINWERELQGCLELKAVTDNFGGAIITTSYANSAQRLHVIKIDSEGNLPWGQEGASLARYNGSSGRLDIISDSSGGVILVQQTDDNSIIAQRINQEGSILWHEDGLLISALHQEEPRVAGDGSGGAIIVWQHMIPCEDQKGASCGEDIYAQKVSAEGNILWQPDGMPIRTGPSNPTSPEIVTDGAGGAIILFDEGIIYEQRINADGHTIWSEAIQETGGSLYSITTDGFGGVIIDWRGGGAERVQRLDAMGKKLWGPNGTPVVNSQGWRSPSAISEGDSGGVLISWTAGKHMHDATLSYVQKVDAQGNRLWGDEGIRLNP